MLVRVGTSGFSYAEWRGSFYPEGLKSGEMLRFYGTELSTVEINNTFYRMPKTDVVAAWYEQVPSDFKFVIKASRRITHQQKLEDTSESVAYLFRVAAILREKLGPILFQLPPFLRKDLPLLDDFLAELPKGCRAALEFRHESWFDDAVYSSLRKHGASLCLSDMDDGVRVPLVGTTDWGYLRLRREGYSRDELASWAKHIRSEPWGEAYVFFKHEVLGPSLAKALAAECGELRSVAPPRVEPSSFVDEEGPRALAAVRAAEGAHGVLRPKGKPKKSLPRKRRAVV